MLRRATPYEAIRRWYIISGVHQRHQTFLTFSKLVRKLGHQVSGGETAYDIIIWCSQEIYCTSSTSGTMIHLHFCIWIFIFTWLWFDRLMMFLFFLWEWLEGGWEDWMCPLGERFSMVLMFHISRKALDHPWLLHWVSCFLVGWAIWVTWALGRCLTWAYGRNFSMN